MGDDLHKLPQSNSEEVLWAREQLLYVWREMSVIQYSILFPERHLDVSSMVKEVTLYNVLERDLLNAQWWKTTSSVSGASQDVVSFPVVPRVAEIEYEVRETTGAKVGDILVADKFGFRPHPLVKLARSF